MSLNIKNKEAHRLAEELAKLTGESMTTAVTIAVRERLDRVRREHSPNLADRLLMIGKDCAAHLKKPFRSADHGDLLYGERGLPRHPQRSLFCATNREAGVCARHRKQRGALYISRQFPRSRPYNRCKP
jgi:antitoxin VapB